jgi:hypothetical protein
MRAIPQQPSSSSISFNNDVVSRFSFGTKEVDCAEMELARDSTENPRVFKGPGYIKRDGNGQLLFKIYSSASPTDTRPDGKRFGASKAGRLIERKFFYTLTAKDYSGQVWTADSILPSLERMPSVVLVHGAVRQLQATKTTTFSLLQSHLRMLFLDEFEIPCNESTLTKTFRASEDEELVFPSSSLNVAKFSSCGFDFLLKNEVGELLVEITSDNDMVPHLDTRVIESLQFVLSKSLHCRISERITGQVNTIRITSEQAVSLRTRTLPPLDYWTAEARRKVSPTWEMFDRYLRFVLPHDGPDWHPCSIHVYKEREASANSPDARALGVSVAVEGLTKLLHDDLGKPSGEFRAAVSDLREFVVGWPGVPGWCGDASLWARIHGLVDQLTSVRAADRLYLLAAGGVVEKRLVDSWKSLRNTMAHADTPNAGKRQEFYDRIMSAVVLLNQLVFSAIGYEGYYSDYSTHGFPVRRYPPGSDTYLREPRQNTFE